MGGLDGGVLRDYDLLREACGWIEPPGLAWMVLRGEDRAEWLQGQATNDVWRLRDGTTLSFCLCSPTGQIESVMDGWAIGDSILLTCDTVTAPALRSRVERMVILEDVWLDDAISSHRLLSIQGATADEELGRILKLPESDAGESGLGETPVWCVRAGRTRFGGWDIWVPRAAAAAQTEIEARFPMIGEAAFEIGRLEAGIPVLGMDISPRTLPPEMGSAFESRHVSYQKGCYVGQEVLMRIHSQGHANRVWVGLRAAAPLSVGARVTHALRADGGLVTSAGCSPFFGEIAAASLRREIAADGETVLVVVDGRGVEAQVQALPFG